MRAGIRRAIFLDRDGVLNRAFVRDGKPFPPASLDEVEILAGVAEGLLELRKAGFILVVVTNQPDVARGTQSRERVEEINGKLRQSLPLDDVLTSYEDGESPRRKPNPGMLVEAAERHGIDLANSFMVGDRWKDMEAGRRAGCRTVFIDYGYRESGPLVAADYTTSEAAAALAWVLTAGPCGDEAARN
jgi:D-glycero-D-manno-heptose 1,7-bisphosphate phosphatase